MAYYCILTTSPWVVGQATILQATTIEEATREARGILEQSADGVSVELRQDGRHIATLRPLNTPR